ncbi:MAG: DUF1573 domain-containing protein [Bacteroidetes bacterium]|jgi:hypothetical protein|nr:DUF1573 domain-containing protein [Bacteroidota bacterium]
MTRYLKAIGSITLMVTIIILGASMITDAVLTFEETKHNFGMIRQGEVVSHDFKFTNTGDAPLIISDAVVTCTCTKVDFPKQPLAKGESGIVKVTFESKSAIDRQERTVVIKSNAIKPETTLTIKCVVLKPKGE